MKRITTLIISIILVLATVLAGCSGTGCNGCSEVFIPSFQELPDYATDAEGEGELMLVKDHESDYVIVIAKNAHFVELDAADELQYFIKEATGAELKIVRDDTLTEVKESDKVILLGDTAYSDDLVTEYDELGDSGFKMNLKGNNVLLKGATPEGTLYSAYEFLSRVIGYEAYAVDEYYFDKTASVKMVKLDNVTDIPAIDYRNPGWYNANSPYAKRMRLINPTMSGTSVYGKDWGSASHSIRNELFPKKSEYENQEKYPGWISETGHICMSNDAPIATIVDKIVDRMYNMPTARIFELGHPDDSARCDCDECGANIVKYGSITGIYMVWLNKIAVALEAKLDELNIDREVTIQALAYLAYLSAPAKMNADGTITAFHPDVMAKTDGKVTVSARYAPVGACFAHSIDDPNCKVNKASDYANELRKWKFIVGDNKLQFYGYVAEFYDYMMFFNDIGMMNGSYKFFEEIDLYGIFDSAVSQVNATGPFNALKVYLKSKLMWDPDLDIRTLIDNFYNNYFGVAGPYMKEVYERIMENIAEISEQTGSGGCYTFRSAAADYKSPDFWPVDILFEIQESIDKAYDALESSDLSAEDKEKIYWRIKTDELFPMHWYVNNYQNVFSDDEFIALEKDFNDSCAKLGITKFSH